MATQTEVEQVVRLLSAAFPDWKPAGKMSDTLAVYVRRLQEFPADLLRRAAERCMDSCLTFPKIVELRRACHDIGAQDANNTYKEDRWVKTPPSPEMQEFLDAFRKNFKEKHGIPERRHYEQYRTS